VSSATFASAIPGENWTGMGGTLSPETTVFKEVKCYKGSKHSVNGRNPAPAGMYKTMQIME